MGVGVGMQPKQEKKKNALNTKNVHLPKISEVGEILFST